MASRSLLPLCGIAWSTYHLREEAFLHIPPDQPPQPASPPDNNLPHWTPALCLSAVMPANLTAFCLRPGLGASPRESLASSQCTQGMNQSRMQILRTFTCCWPPSAQQTLLWKATVKAILGCVKVFIPLKTACCEDALALGTENYGLMSHRGATLLGEGELIDPRCHLYKLMF